MEMKREITKIAAILWVLVALGGLPAQAALFETKLTSEGLGLGLGNVNVNDDHSKIVNADILGKLITSPFTGEGSILYINTAGKAGTTVADPLLVTVTAQTRLDVTTGLPSGNHDYQAGVLFISDEDSTELDGAEEGLGVRAFTVNNSFMRVIDSATGRAKFEGSKEISGGTDDRDVTTDDLNGPPHEDEAVTFDFNPLFNVDAQSVVVLLSKFESDKDTFDLNIELTLGSSINETSLSTTHTAIADWDSADKLWKLSFFDITGVNPGDWVQSFTIRADLNNLDKKSHFWITGMNADFEPVPVPGAVILGVIGLGFSSWLGRRKFSL